MRFKCRFMALYFALSFFRRAISASGNSCLCNYLFFEKISTLVQSIVLRWENRRTYHCKYFKFPSSLTHRRKSVNAGEKFVDCTVGHSGKGKCIGQKLVFAIRTRILLSSLNLPIIKYTPQLCPAACVLMRGCASILDFVPCYLLQQLLCDQK